MSRVQRSHDSRKQRKLVQYERKDQQNNWAITNCKCKIKEKLFKSLGEIISRGWWCEKLSKRTPPNSITRISSVVTVILYSLKYLSVCRNVNSNISENIYYNNERLTKVEFTMWVAKKSYLLYIIIIIIYSYHYMNRLIEIIYELTAYI